MTHHQRISRHAMFMEMAIVASRRSTCYRRNVGAVIVRNKNIVSIGYNGPASGEPHCFGNACASTDGICLRALHAEANAIVRLPPIEQSRLIMYTTESPCSNCANLIVSGHRIEALYYLHLYRVTEGIDHIALHMPTYRMTPSGLIIDHTTNEILEDHP